MREFLLSALAAVLGLLALPQFLSALSEWRQSAAQSQAAQVAVLISTAGQSYLASHFASVPVTGTLVVSIANLQQSGFLPQSVNGCTSFGCKWVLEFKRSSDSQYTGFLFSQFDQPLADRVANEVATRSGVVGGFIPLNDSGLIPQRHSRCVRGADMSSLSAMGLTWSQALSGFTQSRCGQLALLLNFNSALSADLFLHRTATPGDSDLNTLRVPLILAAQRSEGTSCNQVDRFNQVPEPLGSLTSDASGFLVYCDGHVWSRINGGIWKSPATVHYADLPSTGNATGDTRLVSELGRAFSWINGEWKPLGIDQNGNLTLPGSAAAGATLFLQSPQGGFTQLVAHRASGELDIAGSDGATPTFSVTRQGIHLSGVGVAGDSCVGVEPGTLANGDAVDSGYLVICQQGQWQAVGGRIQTFAQFGLTGAQAASGQKIPAPMCPGLSTPQIVATLTSIPIDATNTVQVRAVPNMNGAGSVVNWSVLLVDASGASVPNAQVVVSTFCSYLGS